MVDMTKEELKKTNELHDKYIDEWNFFRASYDGVLELVRLGKIKRHERESLTNFNKRLKELYGFGYSKSIVDLFNHYLFKKPAKEEIPEKLHNDEQWDMFREDCNLYHDEIENFLLEQMCFASIFGHVGILVDKSNNAYESKQEEIDAKVYPYVVSYMPMQILDWRYDRDRNNRPFLAYLKVLDGDEMYKIWEVGSWQLWRLKDERGKEIDTPVLVEKGINPLGEIPWIWLMNLKSTRKYIGVSDIQDIAHIDLSIIRNLSQGEEVIDYAAFPMMRKPMQEVIPGEGGTAKQDEVGPQIVLEFNPEHPESKPDWLESPTGEAINSILLWIARKVEEIYRSSNIGGMAATEIQKQAKSGVALKTEFQLLNSKLGSKASSLEKAQELIYYFWCKWQDMSELFDKIKVNRPREFDIENLAQDLDNILTAKTITNSPKFINQLQKLVVRMLLPNLDDETSQEIDSEIDSGKAMPSVRILNGYAGNDAGTKPTDAGSKQ